MPCRISRIRRLYRLRYLAASRKPKPSPHAKIHQQPQPQTVNAQPQTINAQQQVLIEALPPVLVLHIKRFCYDKESGGVVKVGKRVRFGTELDIGSGGCFFSSFRFCSFFFWPMADAFFSFMLDVMVPAAKKSPPARYKHMKCALCAIARSESITRNCGCCRVRLFVLSVASESEL